MQDIDKIQRSNLSNEVIIFSMIGVLSMNQSQIISKMNEYLHLSTVMLADWLGSQLPRVNNNWWKECVLDNLSDYQYDRVTAHSINTLEELDLAALLRVAKKSWYEIRSFSYLPQSQREALLNMSSVRNNWAHIPGIIPGKDSIENDLGILHQFASYFGASEDLRSDIDEFRSELSHAQIGPIQRIAAVMPLRIPMLESVHQPIEEKSMVHLVSDPSMIGMVCTISEIGGIKKYEVFINGAVKTFFENQIELEVASISYHKVNREVLQSSLTAYQLKNPSMGSLYSLNSARIDFVPYQFRPALKIIKSDVPRILIADSVGVGKTIEAGLILKELQARSNLEKVLIICPKPLVAERKWELEMKRFDEDFIPVNGPTLRQILSDTVRDGFWPERYGRAIIPYSLLADQKLLYGSDRKKGAKAKHNSLGLLDLDPAPHFDMVIVDEAHHIRHSSTYAYAAVKYFCDHADSVLFLTATPLQTGDQDLYTLLNVLRPDLIIDPPTFDMMARPNPSINKAAQLIRAASPNWAKDAIACLEQAALTQWGQVAITPNPAFKKSLEILSQDEITREQRIQSISEVESLHSFFGLINRTRRQDIQDFCIRRSYTVENSFTTKQKELHNELLRFEATTLSVLHDSANVQFMMSTISRQAASCIFGLAPFIKDIINRRIRGIWDDPDNDADEFSLSDKSYGFLGDLARQLIHLADDLPSEDPKFESLFDIIAEKQSQDNNKIIIFSTFKHTLAYLREKLTQFDLRVAQIDGSVKDNERYSLRQRFELDRAHPDAIDILLFTEVGSEGLDYQFCNTMINYDLPWNPMRIEQRIGRIDRRGQQSDVVHIYNMITTDTVDAEIYNRCLLRIGIFEESVGECEEILGEISKSIQSIVFNPNLTDSERKEQLETIANNEVRKIQELRRLEDEEKQLFGFNLSNYTISKELQESENPWISPDAIQFMVEKYLESRVGKGNNIVGEGPLKNLRLSAEARQLLLDDFRNANIPRSAIRRSWEMYLKGNKPNCAITFNSGCAEQNRLAFFITIGHPFAKQAADYFNIGDIFYVGAVINNPEFKPGQYPFSIYAWEYTGYKPQRKLIPVCDDKDIQKELMDILKCADVIDIEPGQYGEVWSDLETVHFSLWNDAKADYKKDTELTCRYKTESLNNSFNARERILLQQIADAYDENILRMKRSELDNVRATNNKAISTLQSEVAKADIHIRLLVNGMLIVEGE